MSIRWFSALAVAASLLVFTFCPAHAEEVDAARFRKLVFFSVLEGLYETGVPDEVVDRILTHDPKSGLPMSFIKGCPVCQPVYDAFKAYRARPVMWGAGRDFGPGASQELITALSDPNDLKRTAAVGDFISDIMARKVAQAALAWSPEERKAWCATFEAAAKEGERQLQLLQAQGGPAAYQMMWSCLVCDGARKGGCASAAQKP